MAETLLTREELYERIWTTPTRHLAKEFGISDVGLAKICKRYQIPKPPPGYWAGVAHGNAPKKPRLRAGRDVPPLPIVIRGGASHRSGRADTHPDVREGLEVASAMGPIRVPRQLRSPLPIIARTQKALRSGWLNDRGLLSPKAKEALDICVAPATVSRAMRIMNALIRALDRLGFPVSARDGRTAVMVCGEEIAFSLTEATSREERPPTDWEKRWAEHSEHYKNRTYYDLKPTGRLVLEITSTSWGKRSRWRDGTRQTLEDLLPKFIVGATEIAGATKTRREEWEAQERERERQEELRRERLAEIACEKSRVAALHEDSNAWHQAGRIREYIVALQRKVQEVGLVEGHGVGQDTWFKWANDEADRLDPLRPSPPSIHGEEQEWSRLR